MAMMARFRNGGGSHTPAALPTVGEDDGDDAPSCGAGSGDPAPQPIVYAKPECIKCGENVALFRVRAQAWCRHCFLMAVQGKVKRGLTQSSATGHRVAIGVSGGFGSRAALAVMHKVMDVGRRHRVFEQVVAVHIDTRGLAAAFGGGRSIGMDGTLAAIMQLCAQECTPLVVVPCEAAFHDGSGVAFTCVMQAPASELRSSGGSVDDPKVSLARPLEDARVQEAVRTGTALAADAQQGEAWGAARARMLSFFSAFSNVDAKQEMLDSCIDQLLLRATAACGISYLLLCPTADSMAIKLLTQTCYGKGFANPLLTAAAEARQVPVSSLSYEPHGSVATSAATDASIAARIEVPNLWYAATLRESPPDEEPLLEQCISVSRPLLDVEAKEVTLYCTTLKLQIAFVPNFHTMATPRSSIAFATESLIAGLQASFVNTVHNVVRTTKKLVIPEGTGGVDATVDPSFRCRICRGALPAHASKFEAITLEAARMVGVGASRGEDAASFTTAERQLSRLFCHGCLMALKDAGARDGDPSVVSAFCNLGALLPSHVFAEGVGEAPTAPLRRLTRSQLRAQVEEFLLEDDSEDGGDGAAPP